MPSPDLLAIITQPNTDAIKAFVSKRFMELLDMDLDPETDQATYQLNNYCHDKIQLLKSCPKEESIVTIRILETVQEDLKTMFWDEWQEVWDNQEED